MCAKIFRCSPIDGFRPQGFSLKKSAPPIFFREKPNLETQVSLCFTMKSESPFPLAVGDLGTKLGKSLGTHEVDGFPFSSLKGSL